MKIKDIFYSRGVQNSLKVLFLAALILIFVCIAFNEKRPFLALKEPVFENGVVVKVYDGDTITMADGKRIRIWGIDAPELNQQPPDGILCRDSLKFIVGGQVKLEIYGKDFYNRYLAKVLVGGIEMDIGLWMVKQGYAWVYKTNRNLEYLEAEKFAKGKRLGIWSAETPRIPPWEFRKGNR